MPPDLEWRTILGINHLVSTSDGRVLGTVRRRSDDIYEARYGITSHSEYVDLESARLAVVAEHLAAIAKPKDPKPKEKKSAGKNA